MSKNVIINGVIYNDVPYVDIPLANETGKAKFVDTDSGDCTSGDIRNGKKAWVGGNEISGNIPEKSNTDVIVHGNTVTIPSGIYDEQIQKSVSDGIVTLQSTVLGEEISEKFSGYPITVTPKATVDSAGYISSIADGTETTMYIQVEEKEIIPTTAQQSILPTAGKLIEKVIVNGVDISGTATESDVLNGKTFFSGGSLTQKTGTATVPTIGQDSVTKVLSIV